MAKPDQDIKSFNMRLPKYLWLFLKKMSAADETSMTEIIIDCVKGYKEKVEIGLTNRNPHV